LNLSHAMRTVMGRDGGRAGGDVKRASGL
jgi:hypothetical protein